MSEVRATAIVLKAIDYRENDKMISLLTPNGRITAVAKGVKKPNAKLKSCTLAFSIGDYIFAQTSEHLTITGYNGIESFYQLTDDITLYYCANVVAECALRFIQQNDDCGQFFLLVAKTLQFLTYENINAPLVTLRFLISAVNIEGYKIVLDKCCVCSSNKINKFYFDIFLGGLVCSNCVQLTGREISSETVNLLRQVASSKYDKLADISIKDNSIRNCFSIISDYINENIVKLKTIEELMKII